MTTSKHPPKHDANETTDGLPPGAHAPTSIGNGMPQIHDSEGDGTPVDPTQPEGHVEDPTLSPKEQADHAQALAELGPLAPGKKRVKLKSAMIIEGQHHDAGKVLDIDEGISHQHIAASRVEVLRGTHTHPPAKGASKR